MTYCAECGYDPGGSHYHCARCNGVCSMMGHYTAGARIDNVWREFKEYGLGDAGRSVFTCDPDYHDKVVQLRHAVSIGAAAGSGTAE